jgi:hypothetical protein
VARAGTLEKLAGGDRRSIGRSDEVVNQVLKDSSQFADVFNAMLSDDDVVRARAADAVEKITRARPDLLLPYKKQLLQQIALLEQQEVRWHVAQMLCRVPWNPKERARAVEVLLGYLRDKSRIVVTFALQALSDLAKNDKNLRAMVTGLLEEAVRNGSPAVRSRAKRLLREPH